MKILGIGNAIVDVICKVEDDFLIKNNFDKAYSQVIILTDFAQQDRFHSAIIESLKQYIYVFKEKK